MLGSCGPSSRVSDQIICARTCAIFFRFYLHILCASHRIATLFIVMFFSSQSREENPEDAVEANKAASIFCDSYFDDKTICHSSHRHRSSLVMAIMCAQADVACNIPVYLFIMNVLVPQLAKKVFAPALEVARRHSLKLARSGTLGSTNAVRRIAHAWIIRTRNRVESRKLSAVAPQLEHSTVDVVPSGMIAADGLRPLQQPRRCHKVSKPTTKR